MSDEPATDIRVERRFEGPPDVCNGGYAGALLAERIGPVVEVSLLAP